MDFYLQNFVLANAFLCLLLAGGMIGLTWLGHRAGRKWYGGNDAATAGWGTLEGAMLGLFGLLMAFCFSGATDRFQNRRERIVEQAQAIGTAYDRLELLDPASREPIRKHFREYLDLQLVVFEDFKDVATLVAKLDALEARGAEIFRLSAAACREERHLHLVEVIPPAVNEMLDVAIARRASLHIHLPAVVFYLLFAMALGTGLLAGFGMTPTPRINWFHAATFAVFSAMTLFVIMDMDFPRAGLFKVESADEALRLVRRGMN